MTDLEVWALTVPVDNELQRTLLLQLAADAVDQLARLDVDAVARERRKTRDEVISELEALEAAGLVEYTPYYQPFDCWILKV